jgi:hypothetical protein
VGTGGGKERTVRKRERESEREVKRERKGGRERGSERGEDGEEERSSTSVGDPEAPCFPSVRSQFQSRAPSLLRESVEIESVDR